jgi:hypothetical protein
MPWSELVVYAVRGSRVDWVPLILSYPDLVQDNTFPAINIHKHLTNGFWGFVLVRGRELCALHKIGGLPLSAELIVRCINLAYTKVTSTTSWSPTQSDRR